MTNSGFVKIWRTILDNPGIWIDDEPYDKRSAFIYLKLHVDWKTGRLPTKFTERYLAEAWKWSQPTIHRFIELLKSLKVLVYSESTSESKVNQKLSHLRLCDPETYKNTQANIESTSESTCESTLRQSFSEPITYKPEEGFKEVKKKELKEPDGNVDNFVDNSRQNPFGETKTKPVSPVSLAHALRDSQKQNPTLPPKFQNLLAKEKQKETQFREQIKLKWFEKFKEPITDSQISLLLGNAKRKIYGFKFCEALLTWINAVNGEGKTDPFGYAKRVAEYEVGVTPYIKEARLKCKEEKNLIGAILNET